MERTLSDRERLLIEACKLAQSELAPESKARKVLLEAVSKAEYDPFADSEYAIMQHL